MAKNVSPSWSQLEHIVRIVSSHLYNRPANPETINGVKCDCVLHVESDNWVIIETTIENSLDKLRTDLAKFAVIRPYLIANNIYPKCFFITSETPNPSLVDSGKGAHVEVLSIREFSKKLFNYRDYSHARSKKAFGSAINPFNGEIDSTPYTPVTYLSSDGSDLSIDQISSHLNKNKAVVLVGPYGTGKSRCVQEIFKELDINTSRFFKFPIAINLKDNWGLMRAAEIITRHLSDLGLSELVDSLMKLYRENSICFLLDGFDEIGAQTWSDNPEKLKEIRYKSLQGVRDLIQGLHGGVLIVGREHYFNSDAEMVHCLGLTKQDPIILRCKNEFTEPEMAAYLTTRKINVNIPAWLPRRPLICQVIAEFNVDDAKKVLSSIEGEVEFWELLINTVCEREAKINSALDPVVIKNVLGRLSRYARLKPNNMGPISLSEIYRAFEECTGTRATDETATMLQRLPGLGRIGPESLDRQFIDSFLLDGLRAEDLVDSILIQDQTLSTELWQHPLREFGLRYTATKLLIDVNKQAFISYFTKASKGRNKVILGDIVASMAKLEDFDLDFHNYTIDGTSVAVMDLSIAALKNLHFTDSIIEILSIADAITDNVSFSKCMILQLTGVSSSRGLPKWITNCSIEEYQAVSTVSRIRAAKLSTAQLVLLAFIRKLFLQPGAARKEAALLRGLGDSVNRKLADKILKLLLREGIITSGPGREGTLYAPIRSQTRRMKAIIDQLALCKDKIWLDVTHIGDKDE